MTSLAHASRYTFGGGSQKPALALVFCAVFMLVAQLAQGQTFSVLHSFTGRNDGSNPDWVAIDRHGNLYGTTLGGGVDGAGTVFKLSHGPSGWILTPLHGFGSGNDGVGPAGVVIGPDGRLYGATTGGGGGPDPAGTVFSLAPPLTTCANALCPWTETVLAAFFIGGGIPAYPDTGDFAFDSAGNIYGTSPLGGQGGEGCLEYGCGTVYEVYRLNGGWYTDVIYSFSGSTNAPYGGVIFDSSGNLYGTTSGGGTGGVGTVYEWTPNTGLLTILYNFLGRNDGAYPMSGLLLDGSGVLYGTTTFGGAGGGGTVFSLSPSGANWTYDLIYSFSGIDAYGPGAPLIMDTAGNLYGTTFGEGAYGHGNVFRLTPSSGSWVYTSLHDFTGGSDGQEPHNVVLDTTGNLYGTTTYGATVNADCPFGCGVVWEIAP
jgi:uncharacterized repeat protein (TIGR03803 family)